MIFLHKRDFQLILITKLGVLIHTFEYNNYVSAIWNSELEDEFEYIGEL